MDDPGILADLGAALRVWRTHPWLVLLPLIIWGAATAIGTGGAAALIGLPLLAFQISEPGIERVWYLRGFTGRTIAPAEIWQLFKAFFSRYFVLGMTFLPLGLMALAPVVTPIFTAATSVPPGSSPPPPKVAWIPLMLAALLVDAAWTFVTPALAFSTDRVRTAYAIGLRMVRDEWPRSAPYVALPPLAVLVLSRIWWDNLLPVPVLTAMTVIATLFNLGLKGASARFYLRRHDCGEDGAAFHVTTPPPPSKPTDPDRPDFFA